MTSEYRTTFHRDDDVTYWSVYLQQWVRCAAREVHSETLATLPALERDRIIRLAEQQAETVDELDAEHAQQEELLARVRERERETKC